MSFTITIVLEKVRPIAMKALVIRSYPSTYAKINHISTLAVICINPMPRDDFPCSLMTLILSPTHTMNKSNEIPKCEKSSINECPSTDGATRFNARGHTKIPANKYQMISGCLASFINHATITTTHKIIASCASSEVWSNWLNSSPNLVIVRLSYINYFRQMVG